MYEKYFNELREECLIRNRSFRTADTYINNIRHFSYYCIIFRKLTSPCVIPAPLKASTLT